MCGLTGVTGLDVLSRELIESPQRGRVEGRRRPWRRKMTKAGAGQEVLAWTIFDLSC